MGYYGKGYKYHNKYGSVYDLYGALSLRDIFTTETVGDKVKKKKDARAGKLRDFYNAHTNADVAAIVFMEYLYMATQDVIEGDIVRLKTKATYPVMMVGLLEEDDSNELIKHGILPENINLVELGYRLPRVLINYGPASKIKNRVIKVPKSLYSLLLQKIRNGKKYVKIPSHVTKTE
jgi:hypothetical protein